jgi:hypothetical protein
VGPLRFPPTQRDLRHRFDERHEQAFRADGFGQLPQVAGALGLGQHHARDQALRDQRGHSLAVVVVPRRAAGVDAHQQALAVRFGQRGERRCEAFARRRLALGRDRIFQIDDHATRARMASARA